MHISSALRAVSLLLEERKRVLEEGGSNSIDTQRGIYYVTRYLYETEKLYNDLGFMHLDYIHSEKRITQMLEP